MDDDVQFKYLARHFWGLPLPWLWIQRCRSRRLRAEIK